MPRSASSRCRAPAPAPVCGSVVLKRAVHAVQAGGCAEETLGNMRTVASLGAEEELQNVHGRRVTAKAHRRRPAHELDEFRMSSN